MLKRHLESIMYQFLHYFQKSLPRKNYSAIIFIRKCKDKQLTDSVVKMLVNKLFPLYNSAATSSHHFLINVSVIDHGKPIAE